MRLRIVDPLSVWQQIRDANKCDVSMTTMSQDLLARMRLSEATDI